MKNSLRAFENSLREYLVDVFADAHKLERRLSRRYNMLKVYMDCNKMGFPHFYVSNGVCEVCFNLENFYKIYGTIGTEDKYIRKWATRPNISGELKKCYKYLSGKDANYEVSSEDKVVQLTGAGLLRKQELKEG